MKKLLVFVFSLLLFTASVTAEITDPDVYTFSMEPIVALKNGHLDENIYEKLSDDEEYKVSQLEWQMKPIWMFGGKLTSSLWNFSLSGSMIAGYSDETGVLKDTDYTMYDGKITMYSEHPITLKNNIEMTGTLAYTFRFAEDAFKIAPFASFTYSTIEWEARNGFFQYPTGGNSYWNENLPKTEYSGKVITFSQKMWYPSAGVNFGVNILSVVNLEANFSAAPYIWAKSKDIHHITNTEFQDNLKKGYGLFGDFKISYSFYDYHTISIFGSATMINDLKGTVKQGSSGSYTELNNTIAENVTSAYTVGISYKLTIF